MGLEGGSHIFTLANTATPWQSANWEAVQGIELKVFKTQKELATHDLPIGQLSLMEKNAENDRC